MMISQSAIYNFSYKTDYLFHVRAGNWLNNDTIISSCLFYHIINGNSSTSHHLRDQRQCNAA